MIIRGSMLRSQGLSDSPYPNLILYIHGCYGKLHFFGIIPRRNKYIGWVLNNNKLH